MLYNTTPNAVFSRVCPRASQRPRRAQGLAAAAKERAEATRQRRARDAAEFVAQPSLCATVRHLGDACLLPLATGHCAVCSKRLLPSDPRKLPKVPKSMEVPLPPLNCPPPHLFAPQPCSPPMLTSISHLLLIQGTSLRLPWVVGRRRDSTTAPVIAQYGTAARTSLETAAITTVPWWLRRCDAAAVAHRFRQTRVLRRRVRTCIVVSAQRERIRWCAGSAG